MYFSYAVRVNSSWKAVQLAFSFTFAGRDTVCSRAQVTVAINASLEIGKELGVYSRVKREKEAD